MLILWLSQVVDKMDVAVVVPCKSAQGVHKVVLAVVVVLTLHALHERVDEDVVNLQLAGAILDHTEDCLGLGSSWLVVEPQPLLDPATKLVVKLGQRLNPRPTEFFGERIHADVLPDHAFQGGHGLHLKTCDANPLVLADQPQSHLAGQQGLAVTVLA